MNKKVKTTPLTRFEYNCIWMSYRYCIGRTSIASVYHAQDIAENCYGRLTDDQMDQMVKDIRSEVGFVLRSTFDFHVDINELEKQCPMGLMFKILKEQNLTLSDLEKKDSDIKGFGINADGKSYVIKYKDGEHRHYRGMLTSDYGCLKEWANLACMLDRDNRYDVYTRDGEGKEKVIVCYKSPYISEYGNERGSVDEVYHCIEEFATNKYINPDYIIKVEKHEN